MPPFARGKFSAAVDPCWPEIRGRGYLLQVVPCARTLALVHAFLEATPAKPVSLRFQSKSHLRWLRSFTHADTAFFNSLLEIGGRGPKPRCKPNVRQAPSLAKTRAMDDELRFEMTFVDASGQTETEFLVARARKPSKSHPKGRAARQ